MSEEIVMMLTEKGMRIFMEEMRKAEPVEEVDEEEEIEKLADEYLRVTKKVKAKSVNYNEMIKDYLKEAGRPVKSDELTRAVMDKAGGTLEPKQAYNKIRKAFTEEPTIIKEGYGCYGYEDQEESQA